MNNSKLKIVQINLARSLTACDELLKYFENGKSDIAYVQKPYNRRGQLDLFESHPIRIINHPRTVCTQIWAAIIVFNPELDILAKSHLMSDHFAVASINLPGQVPVDIISGYIQFWISTLIFVDKLSDIVKALGTRVIIHIDANARSTRWFRPNTNQNRRLVTDMLDNLRLEVQNQASSGWTYIGPRGRSMINVTACTTELRHKVSNWSCTLNKICCSDHSLIEYAMNEGINPVEIEPSYKFNDRNINKKKFLETLKVE